MLTFKIDKSGEEEGYKLIQRSVENRIENKESRYQVGKKMEKVNENQFKSRVVEKDHRLRKTFNKRFLRNPELEQL